MFEQFKRTDNEERKQHVFNGVVSYLTRAVSKYCKHGSPYLYIDMNAFDGAGSPAVFTTVAQKIGLTYRAYLLEQHPQSFCELQRRFAADTRATCIEGNHSKTIYESLSTYGRRFPNKTPYGLIYHDPQAAWSLDTLRDVAQMPMVKRVDIVIQVQATGLKRAGKTRLSDGVKQIRGKSRWLISRPFSKFQWTFLIGSNWPDLPEWKKEGLVDLYSDEGQNILDRLAHTKDELSTVRQMQLDL